MRDNSQELKSVEVREVVVEEYWIGGHHFTRALQIPRGGRSCTEIFTIDGEIVRDSATWLEAVAGARRQASS